MPREIAVVPLIESWYLPSARSRAGAVGVWQLVASTGRAYGLRVDRDIDQRLDPVASSRAALNYLDRLHNRFGSWYLALAAYNMGPTRLAGLLSKHNVPRGSDDSYWAIRPHLPPETRAYVPKVLAAAWLIENDAAFEFPEPSLFFRGRATLVLPVGTSVADAASHLGVSSDGLRALNPSLIGERLPKGYAFPLRVPRQENG